MNTSTYLHLQKLLADPENLLIFIHGFLGSAKEWDPLRAKLQAHFPCQMLSVDVKITREAYSQDDLNSPHTTVPFDLFSLIPSDMHYRQIIIWGYSMGGRLALWEGAKALKARADQSIRSLPVAGLIIESAHPGLQTSQDRIGRLRHDERWAQEFEHNALEEVLAKWYRQAVFSSLSDTKIQQLIDARKQQDPQKLAQILRDCSLGHQPDLRWVLDEIPGIYFYGQADEKFATIAQSLAKDHEKLLVKPIKQGDHNLHQFNSAALVDFLTTDPDVTDPSKCRIKATGGTAQNL